MNFNSLGELKKRIMPALSIKANESKNIISEDDIWNYFSKEKWIKDVDLSLSEMVNDILTCDIGLIKNYIGGERDET